MKKILLVSLLAAFTFISLESCSRKVVRIDSNEQIDLSGRWNDTDAKLAAEELTNQILAGNWITTSLIEKKKKPVVIVGLIRNNSHEHIDSEIFTKEIEKAFIKTQRARVVQGGEMREQLRSEKADQQNNASRSTIKKFGLETGADYMLQGTIKSIVDSHKRQKVIYYQIDLELTDIETNEKVWIGDKKIKKYVKN
jgi:uncharacterized protein (TIGR02722 family)